MKKTILYSFILYFSALTAFAQKPETEVSVYGRYLTSGNSIDLRIIPENRHAMRLAFEQGIIIERADNASGFHKIAEIKVYDEAAWEQAVQKEKNTEAKQQLELSQMFYEGIMHPDNPKINLKNGVAGLKEIKRKEDMQYLFLLMSAHKNFEAMKALGLAFEDTGVQKGKIYRYRAVLKAASPVYKINSPATTIVAKEEKPDYKNYFFVKQDDGKLHFYWREIPGMNGYDIERADDGKNNFRQLNKAPVYKLYPVKNDKNTGIGYTDENLKNYHKYTYRFYGYSLFGERVKLFEMTTFAVDLTPPPVPDLLKPEHIAPGKVKLQWKMDKIPADFKGFVVARAHQNRGKYQVIHTKLLPKTARQFIDTRFDKNQPNYYVVQAVDTANNISSSVPFRVVLTDSIPPAKPHIDKIRVDKKGIVQIEIRPNKEKDLMGYRLFRSNSPKHEFSAIDEAFVEAGTSDAIQTKFTDTISLNSLTKKVYYRVKALDFHYNQSDFSDIYHVNRPDTIPPPTPVFKKLKSYEDRIELHFATGTAEDIKQTDLYRKLKTAKKWKKIAVLKNGDSVYFDKDVQPGNTYYYTMRSMDDSGLYSPYAVNVYARVADKGLMPDISNFKQIRKESTLYLSWKYPARDKHTYFVIYRQLPGEKLKQYKRVTNTKFEDKLNRKGSYVYAVRAYHKTGKQSKLSKKLKINY